MYSYVQCLHKIKISFDWCSQTNTIRIGSCVTSSDAVRCHQRINIEIIQFVTEKWEDPVCTTAAANKNGTNVDSCVMIMTINTEQIKTTSLSFYLVQIFVRTNFFAFPFSLIYFLWIRHKHKSFGPRFHMSSCRDHIAPSRSPFVRFIRLTEAEDCCVLCALTHSVEPRTSDKKLCRFDF